LPSQIQFFDYLATIFFELLHNLEPFSSIVLDIKAQSRSVHELLPMTSFQEVLTLLGRILKGPVVDLPLSV